MASWLVGKGVSLVTVLLRSPEEYLYSAQVEVAGNQTFELMVDTGSPLMSISAANIGGPFYDGACDGQEASFKYGGGTDFTGHACSNAQVKLGGVSVGKPLFVGVNKTTPGGNAIRYGGFSLAGPALQGILGLSYASQAKYQDSKVFGAYELMELGCETCSSSDLCEAICARHGGALNSHLFTPLEDTLFKALDIPQVFSMQCCGNPATQGKAITGKLVFGGVDQSLHTKTSTVQYTPIFLEGFYFVNVTGVGTENPSTMTPFTTPPVFPSDMPAPPPPLSVGAVNYFMHQSSSFYVDSGNPYLGLGSGETYAAVQKSVNDAAAKLGLGPVLLPLHSEGEPACVTSDQLDKFPSIRIELQDGLVLTIPPAKYLKPQKRDPKCLWPFVIDRLQVLGLPVLETYYTVYDKAAKRMGFAPVAGCEGQVVHV